MNSQEYLELTEGFKESFNRMEKENKEHREKYNELYKNICVIYGLVRVYQENDDGYEYGICIDEIRSICSSTLFSHLIQDDE
tara:strand:+ start:8210 stop:8455 length:246 start_codon:yes stop_codon:yes gene_type:complete